MSLRRSATPAAMQLPRELSDILMRNGMQATITMDAAGQPKLMVQGHDSPVLSYNLTSQQLTALTGWGSNYLNKLSYNTFADIVKDDFDIPRNYVHARNVNNRVAMGLHGYRIGVGEYGRNPMMTPRQSFMCGMPMGFGHHHGMGSGGPMMHQRGFWQVMTPFLGWTGRHQDGFHLRRMGGMLVTPQGAPIVPGRPDGRMKPGELQSGGYGFYWKGGSMNMAPGAQRPMEVDVLGPFRPVNPERQHPEQMVEEPLLPSRSTEPAKPYKELITSDVYFTSEKFKECLDSHGLVLDPEKNELVVQSSALQADLTYSVTPQDMEVLMSNSIKDHSVAERLNVLNNILKEDFKDSITMDMLNSNERIPIDLNDVAKAELAQVTEIHQEETARLTEQVAEVQTVREAIQADGLVIPLVSEKEGYHWQQDVSHGRDVIVGNAVAGMPESVNPPNFVFINLRKYGPDEIVPIVEALIKRFTPDFVFIDGSLDLVNNFNDNDESNALVKQKYLAWMSTYKCNIITAVHTNKTNDTHQSQGHLGAMLDKKGEITLECQLDKNTHIITVSAPTCRHTVVPEFSFKYGEDGLPVPCDDTVAELKAQKQVNKEMKMQLKKQAEYDNLLNQTRDIMKDAGTAGISQNNLATLLMSRLNLKLSSVQAKIKLMVDTGDLTKDGYNGNLVLRQISDISKS